MDHDNTGIIQHFSNLAFFLHVGFVKQLSL